jgi:hypothetical protein
MDKFDEDMVRAAYRVLLAGQACIQTIARRSLGSVSKHAFTIDGKMLGDLGELVACLEFGLTPTSTNSPGVDATTLSGQGVEVKATAGESVWIPGVTALPQSAKHVVVVKFNLDGSWVFPYHGSLEALWKNDAEIGKHTTALFSVTRLTRIASRVSQEEKLAHC